MTQISGTGFYERRNKSPMIEKIRKKFFTLTEILVVLIIIMAITSLAFGQFGKRPDAAYLDHVGREIERYLTHASHLASVRGEDILICYDRKRRALFIDSMNNEKDRNVFSIEDNNKHGNNLWDYVLPEDVEVIFVPDDLSVELQVFICQSDGEIHGPEVMLRIDQQIQKLKPSPLSGFITRSKVVHDLEK